MFKLRRIHFSLGLRPGPHRGAHDAPPNPVVGWERGYPLPISHPSTLRRLVFGLAPPP